ncbi:MAG: peptidoglycan editing factor PgeF [Candidatus Cloacimonadota bacterium]|nr:peptidoglycan editing factor PgeF [Candidatus Cloacimonadota bacterium]
MEKIFNDFEDVTALWSDKTCEFSFFLKNGCKFSDSLFPVVFSNQVHSDRIMIVDIINEIANEFENFDGFVTKKKNISLLVKSADCTPVLFYSPKNHVIGAVHSGRKGTQKNIAGKMVKMMKNEFDVNPNEILVALGPSISKRNYKVSKEIFQKFVEMTNIEQEFPFLDLKNTIKQQLINAGILQENINFSKICTLEDNNYHSYREDKTHYRQFSIIRLLK